MRILYDRQASQEYETEVEFNIAPFCNAEWHLKCPDHLNEVFGTWVDPDECMEIGYDVKLVSIDKLVIEDLWGASIDDLITYVTKVRNKDATPIIRQHETDITINGHRQSIRIDLKVYYDKDKPIVYTEVEWKDELYDDEWVIYDCCKYDANII